MITQRLMIDVNNHTAPDIFIRETERGLRQVVFIVTRKDDEGNNIEVDIPDGAVGQLRIVKPTRQFVIVSMNKTTLDSGSTVFTATLPEQAGAVGGVGYYDVRISDGNTAFAFTAQGNVYIDDNVLNSGILEDISEVKGLVFPDDFLTKEDGAAVIDDTTTSTESTWSSSQISDEIEEAIGSIPSPVTPYSTTPVKVSTWITGADVYRVVITGSWSVYAGGVSFFSGVSIPTNRHIIKTILCGEANGYKYVDAPFMMVEGDVLMTRNAQFNSTIQHIIMDYYDA